MHRGLLALLIVALSIVAPAMAWGHAMPSAATVGSGGDVRISLSVGVESGVMPSDDAAIRVDPDDDHTIIVSPQALEDHATIRLLSHDGHVTAIRVVASAEPSEPPRVIVEESVDSLLMIIARIVLLTSVCVGLGALAVGYLLLDPAREAPISGLDRLPERRGSIRTHLRKRLVRVSLAAAALSACALLVAILIHLGSTDLGALLVHTRIGRALGVVVGVQLVLLAWLSRRAWTATGAGIAALIGSVALLALSLSGHATSGRDQVVSGALDTLHLGATSAWVGGLVALLLIHRDLGREEPRRRLAEVAAVVVRFSTLGVVAIAVLAVTGVYRAIGELGSFSDLTGDSYGRALLIKVVIFAALLSVAAVNRFVVHPRLERAARGLDPTDRGAAGLLRYSVTLELFLAGAIMVAVGVMIGVPPPR